ncbi:SHIRT domain-containing protein [Streptococcus sp. Marseille-P6264]|uniref:SHIRT domain-containing protein n=1 Tax=Streptococcus sp. Marseille-P6264 TaxID=2487315 RepID=UPI0011E8901B|nr:SHIRT domain-containing protein [Streptococcus sp. Marseille-P6264]
MSFQDRKIKYSIRKLSVATVSLAIGFLFAPTAIGVDQTVHADELESTAQVGNKSDNQASERASEATKIENQVTTSAMASASVQAETKEDNQAIIKSATPTVTETSQVTDSTALRNSQPAAETVQPSTGGAAQSPSANVSLKKSALENYLKELRNKDFSRKTDESLEILNDLMTAADSVLQTATKQEEIDKVYRNLVTFVNSGLRSKNSKVILGKDKIPSREAESGDTSSKGKLPEDSAKQTDTTYRVEYKFKNSTPIYPLPNKIRSLLPAASEFVAQADDYKDVIQLEPTTVSVPTGTWTFNGFDTAKYGKAIAGTKVKTITGTWSFEPNGVDYEFQSTNPDIALPDHIAKLTPKNPTDYKMGGLFLTEVDAEQPSETTYVDRANKVTWRFEGYDKEKVIIGVGRRTFVGRWAPTPNPEYVFKSSKAGVPLPQSILDMLPKDETSYKVGDTIVAKQPAKESVEEAEKDYIWTFKGYDHKNATYDGKRVIYTGIWEVTPRPHHVSYRFESGTTGLSLPDFIQKKTPKDTSTYYNKQKVLPEELTTTTHTDDVNDGIWTFVGYDAKSKTVKKADLAFVGKWEFKANQYQVAYRFESATAGKDLPAAITALSLNDSTTYVNGAAVSAKQPAQTTYTDTVNDGTWTFKGYGADSTVVNKANVDFVGKWEFKENQYRAGYRFESATAGKNLPVAITALTPSDSATYLNGVAVSAKQPIQTTYIDVVNDGIWTFKRYIPAGAVVNKADVTFVGQWEFRANKYQASYRFEGATSGKALPSAITVLTPSDSATYVNGAAVSAKQPAQMTYTDTVNDGTWTFKGYNADNAVVNKANVEFVGKWTFEANKYQATYRFESATADKTLPSAISALTPSDSATYVNGASVSAQQPSQTTYTDTVNDGTWTFKGYDAANAVVNKANVEFVGKWVFEANKYQASYRFESETAGKALPAAITSLIPSDSAKYVNGASVSAQQPSQTTYTDTVNDGTWTFKGYDAASAVVNKADVEFVGKWTFEAKKYQATYRFESATSDKALPAAITALTPSDSVTYVNGASVSAQQPSQTTYTDSVNDGTWTFKGYDAANAVVNKSNVVFAGKWEFKANPKNAEIYTPRVTEEIIKVGDKPNLIDNVTNLSSLPAGTKVVDITPVGQIDTTKPGTYSGTVRVDYPDGSSTEFSVPVNVLPAPVTETYKVTYRFEGATADNNLPTEVLSLLPQSGTYTTSSSAAIAFVPEAPMPVEVAVASGTWKFVGYEKVEEETSLTFIGKWAFEAKQAPSPQPQPQPEPAPQPVPKPQPQPSPVPPVTPEVKPDQETDSADKAQTDQLVKPESKPVSNDKPAVPTPAGDKAKQATLPNTGSTAPVSIEGATTSALLASLGFMILGRKRKDDEA